MAVTVQDFESTFLTSYPGKALWTLLAIAYNTIRFPFWILYYIPRFTRQHPDWSLAQCVRVRIVRAFLYNVSMVEMKTPLSNGPGWERARFVVVKPAKQASYVDAVFKDPQVRPEPVGITWYPRVPTPNTEKPGFVVLHFHGGAYAIGDGRSQDAGFAAKTFIANSEATHVACPQYRLASNRGGRFPAALQDAVSSYTYLIQEMGISPSKIILSGDSAGGNLALSLTRYITEHGEAVGLPKPAMTWLWSCWCNPETSYKVGPAAINDSPNRDVDYVGGGFGTWGAVRYMPAAATGLTLGSPYISFFGNAFKTDIPLYFSAGECEVLLHDIIRTYEEFSGIKGNKVKLQIEEHAVHDIILVGAIIGFKKEAAQSVRRGNAFLKEILASEAKL